ncbi:MAG: type II toxin-antitoxin system HicA family toxin [Candidatus Diapherotrites archaeon]|nr:type II toxin-antitoxin system HicA family toxin [Candidatus Diapherotrites archaeon]
MSQFLYRRSFIIAGLRQLPRHKVEKILKDNGFKRVRSSKHTTYKKKVSRNKILTTWVPHHKTVTLFVIQHIIRQTEKPREEFY